MLWVPLRHEKNTIFRDEGFELKNPRWGFALQNGCSHSPSPRQEKRRTESSSFFLAGDEGFEPPNAGTRNQCLTTWRIPNRTHNVNVHYFNIYGGNVAAYATIIL